MESPLRIPTVTGIIDRRILANFRIDAEVMAAALPKPFRPKLVDGFAIGGICLIRLKRIRPKFFPLPWGISSENAAHRIAVLWDDAGETKEGVYIPRRDTNSRLNSWAGGTIFPGVHHHARFDVKETESQYHVAMHSDDGAANVTVDGRPTDKFPDASIFDSLESASRFFEEGSLGYSDTGQAGRFDGLELRCENWQVETLDVDRVESSYFEDGQSDKPRFPTGTVTFDCALLMRGIDHEWHGRKDLCCD